MGVRTRTHRAEPVTAMRSFSVLCFFSFCLIVFFALLDLAWLCFVSIFSSHFLLYVCPCAHHILFIIPHKFNTHNICTQCDWHCSDLNVSINACCWTYRSILYVVCCTMLLFKWRKIFKAEIATPLPVWRTFFFMLTEREKE